MTFTAFSVILMSLAIMLVARHPPLPIHRFT